MIRIEVITYNGVPTLQPLLAEFNESGGNIGRAEGSALVLHDPTRTISRTHAAISFQNGVYHIRNLGTAIPVYVNDQPLGNGRNMPVAPGDEIRIDGYTMKVLPGEISHPVSDSNSPSAATTTTADPLALFAGSSERDSLDDFLSPALQQRRRSSPSQMKQGEHPAPASIIPSDFDPFGATPGTPDSRSYHTSPHTADSQDMPDLGFGPSIPNQSIDELFGLTGEKNSELFAPDSPLAPSFEKSDKVSVDPLVALGAAAEKKRSGGEPQRDDVPELQGSFNPPAAKPDAAMRGSSPPDPYGMVLSWDNKESDRDSGEIRSVIIPSPAHDRRKGDRRRGEIQSASLTGSITEKTEVRASVGAPAKGIAQAQGIATPALPDSKPITDREELLRAFLHGAGVPDVAVSAGLTPEFMDMLGQLLRESTQGTLDLLLARTLTKREVRAELTMIAPKENNPLKFSPTVEVALAHLLAPHGRGFMPPLQAMKDAHDDLRSHQFGFMAGMRAALAGVLERFDPRQLEGRLTQKTVLDALLPINRKAKLWDLFAERYKDISHEAEEDFNVLFGKEFLRAYEAQVAKLEQDEKR